MIVNGKETPSNKAYITEELTDRAMEFMARPRENPFCLYLSHKAVHHQFLPPEDLKHKYADVKLDLPREMDTWITTTGGNLLFGVLGPVSFHYRNYCEAVTAMDREIGRLLDRLDELGLSENTVVVYAGDNGYFWGEHNLMDKRYAYEEAIRIPFIVRYPGMIKDPGRRARQMVLNVDLAPTLIDLAGIEVPSSMEGRSLGPILQTEQAPGRVAWLYEYFRDYPYRIPPHRAVRTENLKYIEFEGRRKPELYDLVVDPREKNNLYGTVAGQEHLPQLQAMLAELRAGKELSPEILSSGSD